MTSTICAFIFTGYGFGLYGQLQRYQLYYVVVLHAGGFPWSVFLPVAVYQLWQRLEQGATWRDGDRLLTCWVMVWLVCFSLSATRMPNWLLPVYPAVALLLARFFDDWEHEEVDVGVYSFNICLRALAIVSGVATIGLYVAAYLFFSTEQSNAQWIGLIGLVPVAGAIGSIKLLDNDQRKRVMQTLIATASLLALSCLGFNCCLAIPAPQCGRDALKTVIRDGQAATFARSSWLLRFDTKLLDRNSADNTCDQLRCRHTVCEHQRSVRHQTICPRHSGRF